MISNFKIGDQVAVVDETLEGTVVKIKGNTITINSEGFEYNFDKKEIVKISKQMNEEILSKSKDSIDKETHNKIKKPFKSGKGRTSKEEIDLHMHQLISNERGMSKHDKLSFQLNTARQKIEEAHLKRTAYLIFIHGVGKGILKQELIKLFKNYPNIEFYDADYSKYGFGATEIKINFNF